MKYAAKMRNSNVEMLRLVSMFLILMLHVNFFAIGEPTTEDSILNPIPTFFGCAMESVSLISVNLFVLISGWFSIKFSLKHLIGLIFQSVFIITLIYFIGLFFGLAKINETQILECLFMSKHGWFIKAYIGLFILSPALNFFVEKATKKEFQIVLLLFFIFQTLYACFTNAATFINMGYSTFSFVGLYLLASYCRVHGVIIRKNAKIMFIGFLIGYILWGYLPVRLGVMRVFYMSLFYTNPFNIGLALSTLLLVISLRPNYNRFLNMVAASTFAVYLCHMCNTWTANLYKETALSIYENYSGFYYLGIITLFMSGVFCVAILIDQPRKWIWNTITKLFTPPCVNKC